MSCSVCNQLTCCGCGAQSTQQVCGSFDINPENPDLGQCSPYRSKRTCEAPIKPENQCNDTDAYAESHPDLTPPFRIITALHDQDCDKILDQHGAPILTPVY